jgi:hypothetical protein
LLGLLSIKNKPQGNFSDMAEGGQANQKILLEMRPDERKTLGKGTEMAKSYKPNKTATHNIDLVLCILFKIKATLSPLCSLQIYSRRTLNAREERKCPG